jgi:hypothetical protein
LIPKEYYLDTEGILPRYQRNITLVSKEYCLYIVSKEYYLDIKGIMHRYQWNATLIPKEYYLGIKGIQTNIYKNTKYTCIPL